MTAPRIITDTCPNCGVIITVTDETPKEFTCPGCLSVLSSSLSSPTTVQAGSIDEETNSDSPKLRMVIAVVMIIGAIGLGVTQFPGAVIAAIVLIVGATGLWATTARIPPKKITFAEPFVPDQASGPDTVTGVRRLSVELRVAATSRGELFTLSPFVADDPNHRRIPMGACSSDLP